MKSMKKLLKLIGNIVTVLFILVMLISVNSMLQFRKHPEKVPTVFGYSTMSVLTGSMRPYLQPGDLIIDKAVEAEELKVGDVVTYKVSGSIVTHRVIEIITENGSLSFITRGDANNTEDGKPISDAQLIGKVLLRIPYGGYIASFIRSPIGILIFIVIPVSFMLVGEVKNILSGGNKKEKEKTDPKTV